jgi:CheY-like chemotaxis protein
MSFRVLAVDDEPDVLGLARPSCRRPGSSDDGTNGLEAVERAVTDKPDVIIMDIMMPKLDGLSACTRSRRGWENRANRYC